MAAISWRLCLVLALSVVVSRPSTTVHTGSPDSGWWGTKEGQELQLSATKQVQSGNYAALEEIFARSLAPAKARGDRITIARLMSGVGGARMARFNYQGALSAYLEAKEAAEGVYDWLDLGAIDLNLSNVYEQVWDLSAALRAADEGQAVANRGNAYYQAELLLQIGRLHAELRDRDPTPFFLDAIEAARSQQQSSTEARAWSLLGMQRMALGNLRGSEDALVRAYLLRRWLVPRDQELSYLDLGALRLAQAEAASPGPLRVSLLDEAERFTARVPAGDGRIVSFQVRQQRGRILLLRGDIPSALAELSAAAELAEESRGGMATAELQEQTLAQFIEAAADYGLRTANPKWIEASFLAQERTRASNLRDNPDMVEAWRRKLPARFWTTLAELRAEQSRLRSRGLEETAESDRLQLELISMEADAGLGLNPPNNSENFRTQRSLIHYQSVLSKSAVLLSFDLGRTQSFLWVVTRNSLSVYRLPPRERIGNLVGNFREALERGRPETRRLGKELYRVLFRQLKPQEATKRDWLVSPADELLQLPFAALVVDTSGTSKSPYLIELHSIQIVSGFLQPAMRTENPDRFLGVGDPIYNTADPRWNGSRGWFSASTYASATQLNRLPGSRREVAANASGWADSTVLQAADANKERFLKELDHRPAVIHLATHVIISSIHASEAFVAFGLGGDGQPELLGTTEVAMLRAPNSLVLMTGCESASGDLRAGAGVANLTRAWMLAGASAVIATQWPVNDSDSKLLVQFYERLHRDSPAEALREAQAVAIQSGTGSAGWASYQIYSNRVYGGAQ